VDLATTALRPFARGWLRRVQGELSLLPVPPAAPRQHVSGPEPDRILVLGNGPATGFGVRTQDLGLPGQLARELAARTGRGTEVDLARGRGMTVSTVLERLPLLRLWRYDAVVVTVGATDAGSLLTEDRWERGMRALLQALRSSSSHVAPIVVLGIRPQAMAFQGVGALNHLVDVHAARLDAVTERVVAEFDLVAQVAMEPALRSIGEKRYFSPDSYRAIARRVAESLEEPLDRRHHDGRWEEAHRRRDEQDAEPQRQLVVDRLDTEDAATRERLDRLVRSASRRFGTSGAALTIIDGDLQRQQASIGLDAEQIPRSRAICDRTIQRDGPLVVGDATTDPTTAGTDMRSRGQRVRFYAGFPIESPDGYRVGALCVFDVHARDPAEFDDLQLRGLAMDVQNELWQEQGWAPRV
jgi:lysophospholipase L1-like esterase